MASGSVEAPWEDYTIALENDLYGALVLVPREIAKSNSNRRRGKECQVDCPTQEASAHVGVPCKVIQACWLGV